MISLRSVTPFAFVIAAGLTLAACSNDATAPARGIRATDANLDGKVGDVGNARKNGSIDVSVVLDVDRNATIEIHTGTFDDITNTPHPNGYFTSIQYKVYNAAGRQVLVRNVNFKKDTPDSFIEAIPLCTQSEDDDDDAESRDHSCSAKFLDGWTVSVQANLKGVDGDGKKTDVVRSDGYVMWAPDINMVPQTVTLLSGTGNVFAPNSITKFRVLIPNNKPTPIALGVTTTCAIFIDNVRQTVGNANAFAWITGPTLSIPVNGVGDCQFQAKLTAGAHTIYAAAENVIPDDYDYSNNKSTPATFTAIAEAPDVSAGIFWINGSAPTPTTTVGTGNVVQLGQWVTLLSGTPPGTVTCTATITLNGGGTPATVVGTTTLSQNGAMGMCALPYTFTAAGTYTVSTVVTLPAGVTDKDLTNNTAVNTVTVTPSPMAAVSLNPIRYSDPKLNTVLGLNPTDVTGTLGSIAAADSVHNTDVATFSAPITSTLSYVSSVQVTCSATVNGVNATTLAGFAWVSGPTITLTPSTTNAACAFSLPFSGTNFGSTTGNPYTVVFTVATVGINNSAPAASQTVSGALTEFVRADVSADPFQVTIAGVTTPLTGTGVKQNSSVTIQTTLHNPSNVPVSVACGQVYVDRIAPTGWVVPTGSGQDTIPSALSPVKVNATVSLPANGGTGVCQYTLTAPGNLGLVSIKLLQLETTPAGNNPQDPNPLNNAATGTFTIISNGTFTTIPNPVTDPNAISALQQWVAPFDANYIGVPGGGLNATGDNMSASSTLDKQIFTAKNLALLVIPTLDTLGTFQLSDTVYVGNTVVGVAKVPMAPLLKDQFGGLRCNSVPSGGGTTPLVNAIQSTLVYTADICSQPSTDQAGFHQVLVNVVQSLNGRVAATVSPVFYNPQVRMKIVLEFFLPGSTIADKVTASVVIPVKNLSNACTNIDDVTMMCKTSWQAYTVSTP